MFGAFLLHEENEDPYSYEKNDGGYIYPGRDLPARTR